MIRLLRFVLFTSLAGILALLGLSLPVYFTALDSEVLSSAVDRSEDGLVNEARALTLSGHPGAAHFLLNSNGDPIEGQFRLTPLPSYPVWNSFLQELPMRLREKASAAGALLTRESRRIALERLEQRNQEAVDLILSTRVWSDWKRLQPVASASGVPLDMATLLNSFLAAERVFTPSFLNEVMTWSQSPGGNGQAHLEIYYPALLRWSQLLSFDALALAMGQFTDSDAFLKLSGPDFDEVTVRNTVIRLLLLGVRPGEILSYIEQFPSTGKRDLSTALAMGPDAVRTLLRIDLPLRSDVLFPASIQLPFDLPIQPSALVRDHPREMLALRVLFLLLAFYFLFCALSAVLPNPGDRFLAQPTFWQRILRRGILASVPTIALLLLLEPSLLQQPEPASTASVLRLDISTITEVTTTMKDLQIDNVTLLILLIFFFLQVGLYLFCLVKLSEIRRQRLPDEIKLQLLDNEDNLFDGGLYLGLGGTVASLIFLAMGVVEASLMAAYASTLFGILFVSFLKIFHLRPLRRRLILASETR